VAVGKVKKGNLVRKIGDVDCDLFAAVFNCFDAFALLVTRSHIHPQQPRYVNDRLFTFSFEC
jgi:hypothetical protein